MKNPPFVYHRPESVEEALALLAEHGDDAKILAGGQSLLPTMALRLGPPEQLIDISRLPGLDAVGVADNGAVAIGALVRHADAERSDLLAERAPLVHQAMPYIGHAAIRSRGTVVGSIAHADPAAELPAVALAAGATIRATSTQGSREIDAADFFQGYLTTAMRSDELATEVVFAPWSAKAGGAVVEVARRHGDYAIVGLACRLEVEAGTITDAALAFLGVGSTPIRATAAEQTLIGASAVPTSFDEAAAVVSATLEPTADLHGSVNYRRHLAGVLTRRGLDTAHSSIGVPA